MLRAKPEEGAEGHVQPTRGERSVKREDALVVVDLVVGGGRGQAPHPRTHLLELLLRHDAHGCGGGKVPDPRTS
eukprot:scaffold28225_cov107-Isochrysis_galbana.AAC.4